MVAAQRWQALLVSLFAGLSTGIGASLCLCTTELDKKVLACSMSFSAGVMIYVSLGEVLGVATEYFGRDAAFGDSTAYQLATASLFAGVVLMACVDWLVHLAFALVSGEHDSNDRVQGDRQTENGFAEPKPSIQERLHSHVAGGGGDPSFERMREEPHDDHNHDCREHDHGGHDHDHDMHEHDHGGASIIAVAAIRERRRMLAMATVVGAAIVLHNFPEGAATYVASFDSLESGAGLAFAIAVHNIPEGLSVAMPLLHATGSKRIAIGLGTLSGMAEPLGALLASLVANESSNPSVFGGLFGLTAGMMLFVCIAELLPAAYGEKGVSTSLITWSFFFGCAVMSTSLMLGA